MKPLDILAGFEAELAEFVALRQDLHAHPELSLKEMRTARIVAERLRGSGLEVHEGIGGHGVVATLRGTGAGEAIALRADMDALAIEERTNKPYASRHAGVMHACGHDGHTAMLLGAAHILAKGPPPPQDVHFIFQPAEERHGGARRMMDDGLFQRFACRAIYGLHNSPNLTLGRFSTRIGPMMAAVAMFEITLMRLLLRVEPQFPVRPLADHDRRRSRRKDRFYIGFGKGGKLCQKGTK